MLLAVGRVWSVFAGACCASAAKDEELSELVTVRQGMKRFIQALVRERRSEVKTECMHTNSMQNSVKP